MDVLYWTLCILLVILGFAGIIVPGLPGAPLVFLGLLTGAWIDDFQKVGWLPLIFIGLLGALTFVVDFLATALGAQHVQASGWAIFGATLGTLIGLFFGFVGILFMPLIGAAIGEYLAKRNLAQSAKVGIATWIGMIVGSAAKIALQMMMVGIFIIAYFLD
ncbi:MAG: DUF456 domain-containing protein [Chloroherpetonaceae bacterium]|nr:DUF456 family protein [Chloroherpetonaceae bacterium]MCS7210225.1 DUF456 family protein [Chloroherpetonaceae bacterium]MDW8019248.1 DUF456 domain-containing protein [Chloroherpetonaceae bacterium]MDW8467503.1 DUF456 domain-containing protein [Chloroherpetonaceae bacterium]